MATNDREMNGRRRALLVYWQLLVLCSMWINIRIISGNTDCGYTFTLDQPDGLLRSPNYPLNYRAGLSCTYNFLPAVQRFTTFEVCFRFHHFSLQHTVACDGDFLEFPGGVRFCGAGVRSHQASKPEQDQNISFHTVWDYGFCWKSVGGNETLSLRFVTSTSNSGFLANYNLWEPTDRNKFPHCEEPSDWTRSSITARRSAVLSCKINCPDGTVCDLVTDPTCVCNNSAPCNPDQFTCLNRKCISSKEVCDWNDDCGDKSDENYSHARCLGFGGFFVPVCDFEVDTCGLLGFGDKWRKVSASESRVLNGDHTAGSDGHYIQTHFSNDSEQVPPISFFTQYFHVPKEGTCLSFWYYIIDDDSGTLSVKSRSAKSYIELWNASHGSRSWHSVHVDLTPTGDKQTALYFGASRGAAGSNPMMFDDIVLQDGQCVQVQEPSCTFENTACGWVHGQHYIGTDDVVSAGWVISENRDIGYGKFLLLKHDGQVTTDYRNLTLYSPNISLSRSTPYCVRFRLYISSREDYLSLIQDTWPWTEGNILWNMTRIVAGQWNDVEIDVQFAAGRHRLALILKKIDKESDVIAIDDISITSGMCDQDAVHVTPDPSRCREGTLPCAGSDICVLRQSWCDDHQDCPQGEDEDPRLCHTQITDTPTPINHNPEGSTAAYSPAVIIVIVAVIILIIVVVSVSIAYARIRRRQSNTTRTIQRLNRESENNHSHQLACGAHSSEGNNTCGDINNDNEPYANGIDIGQISTTQASARLFILPKYEDMNYSSSLRAHDSIDVQGRRIRRPRSIDAHHNSGYCVRYLPDEYIPPREPPPRYSDIMRHKRTNTNHQTSEDITRWDTPQDIVRVRDQLVSRHDDENRNHGRVYAISGSLPTYDQAILEDTPTNPQNTLPWFDPVEINDTFV